MLQKIQRFGGAMFAPAMLFSISGLMVGVSALATSADIVGDLAVYGTPWYVFGLSSSAARGRSLNASHCFLQISPRECTKRAGIKAVLDALGPDHGTVYGIGDASNDIALMEAVDVGVAMGNAPDFLKEKADYVTDSFDHDGVVIALEHFGLI